MLPTLTAPFSCDLAFHPYGSRTPPGLEWWLVPQPRVPLVTAVATLHPWLFTGNHIGVRSTGRRNKLANLLTLVLSAEFRNYGEVSVRPEPVEGLTLCSWFDKLTTNG